VAEIWDAVSGTLSFVSQGGPAVDRPAAGESAVVQNIWGSKL